MSFTPDQQSSVDETAGRNRANLNNVLQTPAQSAGGNKNKDVPSFEIPESGNAKQERDSYDKFLTSVEKSNKSSGEFKMADGKKATWHKEQDGSVVVSYEQDDGRTLTVSMKRERNGAIRTVKEETYDSGYGNTMNNRGERVYDGQGHLAFEYINNSSSSDNGNRRDSDSVTRERTPDGTYIMHRKNTRHFANGNPAGMNDIVVSIDDLETEGGKIISGSKTDNVDGEVTTFHYDPDHIGGGWVENKSLNPNEAASLQRGAPQKNWGVQNSQTYKASNNRTKTSVVTNAFNA